MLPGLRPVQVGLLCIPCARVPFLHRLRSLCIARGLCSSVVRRLRQYYGLVRLPSRVHGGCDPSLVVRPFHFLMSGNLWDLPVLAIGVSVHAQGLRLRRTGRRLANCVIVRVAFPHKPQGLPTKVVISELNTWPTHTPVVATPVALLRPAYNSGPEWLARPSL